MTKRSSVEDIVGVLGKRLSLATIAFHTAAAARLGLGPTDAKCRTLLLERGAATAGELAAQLGVTTGAVTGIIDRLVAAKLARRVDDPRDRRRVVVEPIASAKRDRAHAAAFAPMRRQILALVRRYTPAERERIYEFLTAAAAVMEAEAARLR